MGRPVTLFTGQWADLPFTEVCRLAADLGYDGLEIACWGDHFDVEAALADDAYLPRLRAILDESNLNDIEGLEMPSLENVARWIFARLEPKIRGLDRVALRRGHLGLGEGCVYRRGV